MSASADRGDFVSAALLLTMIGLGWVMAGLSALGAVPITTLAVPVAVFVLLLVAVFALKRARRGLPPAPTLPDVEPAIGRATAWEAIGIVVAVAGANLLHRPAWIVPLIAVVVGLHFLPLARALSRPLYRVTGAALCVVGLCVPLLVPVALGPRHASGWQLGAGIGGGVVLWLTVLALLVRGWAQRNNAPHILTGNTCRTGNTSRVD